VRIHLLGDFRVHVGTRVIPSDAWRLRRARDLVKLLALAPDQRLSRHHARDLLWSQADVASPEQALHKALHTIRGTLVPDGSPTARSACLACERGMLALYPGQHVWVDVKEFESASSAARRSREISAYHDALALYPGALDVEDSTLDSLVGRREELHALHGTLLAELANLHAMRGERDEAILTLHRLVASHPTREDAHRGLMRLYADAGRRYEAEYQYQRLCDILRRELDVEPEVETQRLYHTLRRAGSVRSRTVSRESIVHGRRGSADASPIAPAPSLTPIDHYAVSNGHVTSFIGRQCEIVAVSAMLIDSRVVTLTGPGGCGKTRLAEQVATETAARNRDGTLQVPLAMVANPQLVPDAVARQVGIREEAGRPLLESLAATLVTQAMLLLLDNCEHVRDACADLAETLLQRCQELRILATSRATLGLAGETTWRVPSLALPAAEHLPPLEHLLSYDAIRLFVERATLARPGFTLTPQNAFAIVSICHRLDGIPLALELAAGRIRFLSPAQIEAGRACCHGTRRCAR
jgi:DNA-binding SARP family transcriptional activator